MFDTKEDLTPPIEKGALARSKQKATKAGEAKMTKSRSGARRSVKGLEGLREFSLELGSELRSHVRGPGTGDDLSGTPIAVTQVHPLRCRSGGLPAPAVARLLTMDGP